MPKKLVTNTVGRRLTHSRPESTASSSTSMLRSPRKRDGCLDKSSSALIADNATRRVTPASRATLTTESSSSPSARESGNRRSAVETGRGRIHAPHAGGKSRCARMAGDRADVDPRVDEVRDERTTDVAGGAGDENCVHDS